MIITLCEEKRKKKLITFATTLCFVGPDIEFRVVSKATTSSFH